MHVGDRVDFVGIVVSGAVNITQLDKNGNENIFGKVASGEIFGVIFACADVLHSPVSIAADSKCTITVIKYKKNEFEVLF